VYIAAAFRFMIRYPIQRKKGKNQWYVNNGALSS
jgi:hypothetical protein